MEHFIAPLAARSGRQFENGASVLSSPSEGCTVEISHRIDAQPIDRIPSRMAHEVVQHYLFPATTQVGRELEYDAISSRAALKCSAKKIAFVVEDAHQGRGIGRTLVDAVVARTAKLGFHHLVGQTLAHNSRMRGLLSKVGHCEWTLGYGEAHFKLAI